jgi:hypothetical protein
MLATIKNCRTVYSTAIGRNEIRGDTRVGFTPLAFLQRRFCSEVASWHGSTGPRDAGVNLNAYGRAGNRPTLLALSIRLHAGRE